MSFEFNPAATEEDLHSTSQELGLHLPTDYLAFLRRCNGGVGAVGAAYVHLWRADELLDFNQAYRVTEFFPGLLLFGSNGGGEGFAFTIMQTPWAVVQVPLSGAPQPHPQGHKLYRLYGAAQPLVEVGVDLAGQAGRRGAFHLFLNGLHQPGDEEAVHAPLV